MMNSEGTFRTFDTGAVRDTASKKPMIHLISPFFLQNLGEWLRFACQNRKPEPYPPRNWEKGMPFSETLGSGLRHLVGLMAGDDSEDHAAALGFAAMAISHYQHEIKAGRMDPAIDDMPKYSQQDKLCLIKPTHIADNWEWKNFVDELYTMKACSNCGTIEAHHPGDKCEFCNEVISADLKERTCDCKDWTHCSECDPDAFTEEPEAVEPSTFYITGPMRGIPQLNFPAFDKVAKLARAKGLTIISPAELDREHGMDPINDPASIDRAWKADPNLLQTIVQRDCEIILNLKKDRGDGLILVPKWQYSTGARAEVALALWLGLKFKTSTFIADASSGWVKRVLFGDHDA